MTESIHARRPILALLLLMFGISNVFAAENKVIVIPLGADSTPATGLEFTCPAVGFFPLSQQGYGG